MDKQEIANLLMQIKVFYPRFEIVEHDGDQFRIRPAVIDAWYKRLGYMELEQATKILDQHLSGENGGRIPTINLWLSGGKQLQNVRSTASLERQRGVIRWEPEPDKVFEFRASFNQQRGAWEDEDGRLWAFPGEE